MLFALFVSFIIFNHKRNLQGLVIFLVMISLIAAILKTSLYYGDIFINEGVIIVEKITGNKRFNFSEVKSLKKTIIPSLYCVEFSNKQKVYFMIKFSDILNQVANKDSNQTLEILKAKFKINKATN